VHADQAGEYVDDAASAQTTSDVEREALTRPLIDDREAVLAKYSFRARFRGSDRAGNRPG
jgi:hypothetical protein